MNYFDFYGLPIKFNLNEQELKTKYLEQIKSHHPDFFIHDPLKYKEALTKTSYNNEAYKCLSKLYSRANYILEQSPFVFNENLPSDFLMHMMDLNETLDTLKLEANEATGNILKSEIVELKNALDQEFISLIEQADKENTFTEGHLKAIKTNLLKHKYLLRLSETLANIAVL